jgi:hypothetical protein
LLEPPLTQKGLSLDNYLEKMVKELGEITYQDIEIKLFQMVIDDITFGLIADQETETGKKSKTKGCNLPLPSILLLENTKSGSMPVSD